MPRTACAFVQADLGLCFPPAELMDIVIYVDEQRMPRSDSMDAHAHLDPPVCIGHKSLFTTLCIIVSPFSLSVCVTIHINA